MKKYLLAVLILIAAIVLMLSQPSVTTRSEGQTFTVGQPVVKQAIASGVSGELRGTGAESKSITGDLELARLAGR